MATVYEFSARDIDGKERSLSEFQGKVLLIVNVASQCGFTPQYKGLEDLHRKYAGKAEVLGFPSNQFGAQEPGDETEIKTFCTTKYDVTFPLFSKIDVNGPAAHPLYKFLEREKRGLLGTKSIKWNFTKFLVAKDGRVVRRFAPSTTPEDLEAEIVRLL